MNENREKVIEFAKRRLNDPNNSTQEIGYWSAYIDGATAQLEELEECLHRLIMCATRLE